METPNDSATHPRQIWLRASAEGEDRLERSTSQLIATGLLGGFDITLGVFAMVTAAGSLLAVTGTGPAELVGALAFGLGLAFIAIGRSELFTENFLVPMVALARHRGTWRQLARLWLFTLVGNAVGVVILALVIDGSGLLASPDRDRFAIEMLHDITRLGYVAAFWSAVLAGIVMTLFTWLLHAVNTDVARVLLAFGVGALLTLPPLLHVVVASAELSLGVMAGGELPAREAITMLAIAAAGNLVGGIGFVTLGRSAQVLDWPSDAP